jgi:outer membrane protein assembly factor BamB
VYAIDPSGGAQIWTCDVDAVIGAFPALSLDGVLYCVTNGGTLYAINTATWSKTLTEETTGSAVAVDANGNIYVGTNKEISKYSASGEEVWKVSSELNVTERGAFAIDETALLIKYIFVSLRKKCDMKCPKCSCEESVKSGIIKGRQRYKCKECG